jgi:signal transduction histidine kinase
VRESSVSQTQAGAWPEGATPVDGYLFEYLPQAALLLDRRLRVGMANRAASDLFQLAPAALVGLPITDLVPHQSVAQMILDFGQETVKVIEIHPLPEQEIHLARILKITVVRLPGEGALGGAPLASVPPCGPCGAFRLLLLDDVTEKARIEEQLVQAEQLVAMGQLASGIAHELANPLSSVSSNLQYVWEKLKENGDPALTGAIEVTLDHVDEMRHLLRSLLDFTVQHRPHYQATDVHDLLRQKLAFIGREAEEQGVEVAVSFAPSLTSCHLDIRTVKQALLNILKNALEAMPLGGKLSVRTRMGHSAPCGGDVVVVEIEDTGAGIEEAELRKVFRPLYSTKPRSTGLGLPFCRQVVEEHGGEIHLASRKGRGTTVTLLLPVQQEDPSAE